MFSRKTALIKNLIVTADDFGLSVSVNAAVEEAYKKGILTSASLMVSAPAAADAVERARNLPGLGVGLHVVLVDGRPVLPPEAIPDLVGPDGRFSTQLIRTGANIFCRRSVQRQVAAEIRAQLEAFRQTGLPLDHVNGHHHFHQHPTVLGMIIDLAREFSVKAVRVPYEPFITSWQARHSGLLRRLGSGLFYLHRAARMKILLGRARIRYNDYLFGLNDSGRMDKAVLLQFLAHLPEGISEVYCHPAAARWAGVDTFPENYLCEQEFQALVDPAVVTCLQESNIRRTTFTALPSLPE